MHIYICCLEKRLLCRVHVFYLEKCQKKTKINKRCQIAIYKETNRPNFNLTLLKKHTFLAFFNSQELLFLTILKSSLKLASRKPKFLIVNKLQK